VLVMTVRGKVTKHPEHKISAKGTAYTKLVVEVPAGKQGQWGKRVFLTAFGPQASDCERLAEGFEVEVVAEPQARGYADKLGKPAAVLEGIVRSVKVLSAPQPMVFQHVPEPTITEDDIPF